LAGFEVTRISTDPAAAVSDIPNADRKIIRAVKPYTATSSERVASLVAATRYVARAGIPGDIVECGVWRGGSMMATIRLPTLLRLRWAPVKTPGRV
jgi:hypothetical protein